MPRKTPDLTQQKIDAIAKSLENKALNNLWGGFDPDKDIEKSFAKPNRATRIKSILLGMLLFGAPIAAATASDIADKDSTTPVAVRTLPLLAALGTGALGGCIVADRKNKRRMSDATLQKRATEILILLEMLKVRPLTPPEWNNLDKIATLSAHGSPVEPSDALKYELLANVSRLDEGYIRSLRYGNLYDAADWIQTMIKAGHYTSHER